jgi:predicted amidohydrolase
MRIGHCQIVSKPGDFEGNLAKVVQGLEKAHKDRVEVLSFPECYLTGYQDTEEEVHKHAFAADSAKMMQVLDRTSHFDTTLIVGFNELRGKDLYNTCLVAYKGHLLGLYSKCAAYLKFHNQGRDFPVFEHNGVKFGVIICADGGYVEPSRILALKGAKIIFAPHYNYIGKEGLLRHFMQVRADHVARARENNVHFVRGNNVVVGPDEAIKGYDGVGYGDSYILDPDGEMVVRSRRHVEDYFFADIVPAPADKTWDIGRSRWSLREFAKFVLAAAERKEQ